MKYKKEPTTLTYSEALPYLVASIAIYGLIRKSPFKAAFLFYPSTGGGGLNLFKQQTNGNAKRIFALDYHPLWNSQSKQKEWTLHYHYGKSIKEMKQHRTFTKRF